MSATATPPAAAATTAIAKPANKVGPVVSAVASLDFSKIPKKGSPELLKVKEVHVFKKLQARDDTDSGSVVDEGRCQLFALAMDKGAKFPAIKVMRVLDAPGRKNEETDVCWDGMHTLRGKEIAKQPEVDAEVWVGTFAQAQYLAATRANREHETNGKPLSSRDKIHAVKILAAAYKDSDIPKKDWPSNRNAADIVGCSRQLVNDMDPFERGGKGDVRELKAAKKRAERKNGDPADGGEGGAAAAAAPKPGQPVGFDWAGMDNHMGYLIRGTDGMGDIFNIKGTPEYVALVNLLAQYAERFTKMRATHGKKKAG